MNWRALIKTLLFFGAGLFLLFSYIERPLLLSPVSGSRISAIAVRDNVSAFEKRGSALFTLPYLEKFYYDFDYIESATDWITPSQVRPSMERLLNKSDSLDVYILSHGNKFYQWFSGMDTSLRKRIRLVYNTGCENDSQRLVYKNKNVRFYVGHSGQNSLSPVFYAYFLRRMFSERNVEQAARSANERSARILDFFINDRDTLLGSLGKFHDLRKE